MARLAILRPLQLRRTIGSVREPDRWEREWHEIGRRIELPLQGLRELSELRRSLDLVERELVAAARRNWSSWQEIGGALGISRQAAHARHGPFVKRKGGSCPGSSG